MSPLALRSGIAAMISPGWLKLADCRQQPDWVQPTGLSPLQSLHAYVCELARAERQSANA